MSRCVIVSTGGTIASLARKGTGYVSELSGQQIRDLLPEREFPDVEIEVDDFSNILSQAMTPANMLDLAYCVKRHLADPDVRGVVVTHGTVVMEESAFLCDLIQPPGKPVVFTGAMIPVNDPATDGLRNLANSIHVSVSSKASGLGTMVCMNGDVHAARWVRKLHTGATTSFGSPNGGLLGHVDGQFVRSSQLLAPRRALRPKRLQTNVDLISMVSGMDDRFLVCSKNQGAKGIVIEGLPGKGAVPPLVAAALPDILRDGIIVVLASRSPSGKVLPSSGGSGGSYTLAKMGVLMGGELSGPKLRLLLMAALGQGMSSDQIKDLVLEYAALQNGESV
jgi:L-asparaginase